MAAEKPLCLFSIIITHPESFICPATTRLYWGAALRVVEGNQKCFFFIFSINIYLVSDGSKLTEPGFLKIISAFPVSKSYILNKKFTLSKVEGIID
jgi:hypothetical protein